MMGEVTLPASDRDGDGEVWPGAARMLDDLLAGRHSCRGYKPQEVPRPVIERMLAMTQRSASWCNSQPWQVIVTAGAATDALREALLADINSGTDAAPDIPFPTAYRGVYQERRRETGWKLYDSVGVTRGDREGSNRQALENFRLFGAPHALVVTSSADLGSYGAIDCGIYVGNLLLAAQSLGLGMIAQAALAARAPLLRRHFGIPDDRLVVLGASFGYPDAAHPANSFRTSRAGVDEAVQWIDR